MAENGASLHLVTLKICIELSKPNLAVLISLLQAIGLICRSIIK